MLEDLHVRDLALIEEVWLEFDAGMTVITGETGAGKTALLGALKLLLGERADSGAVRAGSAAALVEGRFTAQADELVAQRRVSADGRSRCTVNGEMVTVGALADTIGPLVDLHGQHDHQALLSPGTHVGYLDRWCGQPAAEALADYRHARHAFADAARDLEHLREGIERARDNADYLRFLVDEIDRVDPQPGEAEDLEARLPALQHAEKLSEAAGEAATLLRGDGGALDKIALARAALEHVSGIDPALDDLSERLAGVEALADDAGTEARRYRDAVEHDPAALEATLSRLSALGGLMKKYGPRLEDVIVKRYDARQALEVAQGEDAALDAALAAVEAARARLEASAATLVSVRQEAVSGFVAALADAAADLAMAGSRFDVSFNETAFESWGDDGPHRVEFLYAPSAEQPARPLVRIASGGELSRVMLALKGVLGAADTVGTLVFDEVDAGIGGHVAHDVGRRLAALAGTHQVIVVTHLAQVAAFADHHIVVTKGSDGERSLTSATVVEGQARELELARMLGGAESETGLAHARELIAGAVPSAKGEV